MHIGLDNGKSSVRWQAITSIESQFSSGSYSSLYI